MRYQDVLEEVRGTVQGEVTVTEASGPLSSALKTARKAWQAIESAVSKGAEAQAKQLSKMLEVPVDHVAVVLPNDREEAMQAEVTLTFGDTLRGGALKQPPQVSAEAVKQALKSAGLPPGPLSPGMMGTWDVNFTFLVGRF